MHKQDTVALNQHALAGLMREQQLKQWWLADQIMVDKRTVNRWLTGRVRRISRDNLARLAALLKCGEEQLVYADETDTRATQQEQSQAASLLVEMKSRALFAQSEEYALYESLLKAVMHPNMKIEELAQIYGQLTIAAARQHKPDQAKRYAELTLDYTMRCGDVSREFSARNNIVAATGELGQLEEARDRLHDLCSFAESVGNQRGRALAQINLMHACRLLGEMPEAVRNARQCIVWFREHYESNPLLGAYLNAAALARDVGRFELARKLRLKYLDLKDAEFPARTIHSVQVFVAETLSLDGHHEDALALLAQHQQGYVELSEVQDGELVLPASILRRAGRLEQARGFVQTAREKMHQSVYDPPFILEEEARIAAAAGDWRSARRLRREANKQFSALGMGRRCTDDPALDAGQLFKPPSREKLDFGG